MSIFSKFRKSIERPKKEEAEFGRGKKDIVICQKCEAVYYYKSWHHKLEDYKHLSEEKTISFLMCPACKQIEEGKYEGQVIFENIPAEYRSDIVKNIKNTGERAYKRDPMDRIISIDESGDIEVRTTENQLARNIARQVVSAFKNLKSDIKWAKQESTVRVVVRFKT